MGLIGCNLLWRAQDRGFFRAQERVAAVHEIVTTGCEGISKFEEPRGRLRPQRPIVHEVELEVGCRSGVELDTREESCQVAGIVALRGVIRGIVEPRGRHRARCRPRHELVADDRILRGSVASVRGKPV